MRVWVTLPFEKSPAAAQAPSGRQSTPKRVLRCAPAGLGVDSTAQAVPFHCSASVNAGLSCELADQPPTAVHAKLLRHDTPFSAEVLAPAGLGDGWRVHLRRSRVRSSTPFEE